ncbi:MAG: adenylate kinase [Acidobacteriota bacterium]
MPEIIILMGPQGAGKGTQAQMLAERFALPIVATGDILRAVAKTDTPLGRQVKEMQDAGNLVSDDILAELINERTRQDDCLNGYLLDGFPRTVPQTELLEQLARQQGHSITVISIDVPRDLLFKRLAGRLTCSNPSCGRIYNIYFKPPKVAGKCDVCGSDLYKRDDDTEEAIAKRLAEYDKKTKPLLDYFAQTERLKIVDGTLPPTEVFDAIAQAVNKVAADVA